MSSSPYNKGVRIFSSGLNCRGFLSLLKSSLELDLEVTAPLQQGLTWARICYFGAGVLPSRSMVWLNHDGHQ